jgi:hypothetical protein
MLNELLISTMYYDAVKLDGNVNQIVKIDESNECAICDYDETTEDIMADIAHELAIEDLKKFCY